MFCSKCGSKVEDGVKFCPNCGNSMDSSAKVSAEQGCKGTTTYKNIKDNPNLVLLGSAGCFSIYEHRQDMSSDSSIAQIQYFMKQMNIRKRQVLAEHLAYLNKRLNEVPQFGAYAITSGPKRAFSAFGRLARKIVRIADKTDKADISQYLPGFAELLDLCDG